MSEHLPHTHEQHDTPEYRVESSPSVERHSEKDRPIPEQEGERAPSLETIRYHAKQEAKSQNEQQVASTETATARHATTSSIDPALATMTRNRLLKHVRAHLAAPDRTLSKLIHQPAIDQLSEATGKTIARPSAMLGGGICALLGSTLFLYISKHYGYRYNFLLFVGCFIGGMIIGLILEWVFIFWRRVRD